MKKLIAAAAGLMLVGTMAGTTFAAVETDEEMPNVVFSGDARARFLYQSNKDFGEVNVTENEDGTQTVTRKSEKENLVTSRTRLAFRGQAPGGAFVSSRIRVGDGTWSGGDEGTKNVTADRAYIGVPMGMTQLDAGRFAYSILDSTAFFQGGEDVDGLQFRVNPTDTVEVGVWWFIDYEAFRNGDTEDDNDDSRYGIYTDLKFAGDWGTRLAITYRDDQVLNDGRDDDGAAGGIEFMGPAGPVALTGALAFNDEGPGNTGWGGFLRGGLVFGATSVALEAGFTDEGFVTDDDYGFIMAGGASGITAYVLGDEGTSNYWVGLPVSFAVSEMLTLSGNLVYIDMDEYGDMWELSGRAKYLISDGANLDFVIGYLGYSRGDAGPVNEESPFGAGATFNVSF